MTDQDPVQEYQTIVNTFSNCISPHRKFHEFFWLVKFCDMSLSLKFYSPNFPSAADLKIYGDDDIISILSFHKQKYTEYCGKVESVLQYMICFNQFLQCIQQDTLQSSQQQQREVNFERDLRVITEIESVGFDKVTNISLDLLNVEFSYIDPSNSKQIHKLQIIVPDDFPDNELTAQTCLPETWQPTPTKKFLDLYTEWMECVEDYVPAWRELNELDRLCWILDPDPPSPAHMYRRLAAGPSLSIQIEIEAEAANQLPQIKFFGAESKVSVLRARLCENADEWDQDQPVLNNLENILGLEFPDKMLMSREELKIDCWICYTYNLEGATPSTICSTEKCSACFHDTCIHEWLKSVPESRITLETIFGTCPYCSSPISVKIPK